jgi:hypothetical protein
MGYYIETPESKNKAGQLVNLHQAEFVLSPEKFDLSGPDALICVVENGGFDAAAIAFDEDERNAFLPSTHDRRPRTWLKLSKTKVLELCPQAKHVLK